MEDDSLADNGDVPKERQCISALGIDAGKVNLGMGGIKQYGLTQLTDENGVFIETIPDFEITGGERWDLTRGIVYRPAPNMFDIETYIPSPPSIYSNKLKDVTDQANQCVPKTKWLFESAPSLLHNGERRLPILFVENQSDFVQRDQEIDPATGKKPNDFKKAIMGQIANSVANAIACVDATKDDGTMPRREKCGAMSKYGQRCDGSRDRPERKEEEVRAWLELLCKVGTPNALSWLSWFKNMLAIGEQIHDIVDAQSLALAASMKRFEKHGKAEIRVLEQKARAEIKARKDLLKSMPKAPIRRKNPAAEKKAAAPKKASKKGVVDIVEDKDKAKKARKKGESKGKKSKKVTDSDDSEEEAKPKKTAKKKTVGKKAEKKKGDKKKKKKRVRDSESDDVELVVMEPVKKKGKPDVELVYPILLADEPLVQ
jgi:hypothetical protein